MSKAKTTINDDAQNTGTEMVDPKTLVLHPLLERCPAMEPNVDAYIAMRDSIEMHGVIDAVRRLDGLVVDGRHRIQIAIELGIDQIPFVDLGDADAESAILEFNMARKNMPKWMMVFSLMSIIAPMREKGLNRRKMNLRPGGKPNVSSKLTPKFREGVGPFIEKLGISSGVFAGVYPVWSKLQTLPEAKRKELERKVMGEQLDLGGLAKAVGYLASAQEMAAVPNRKGLAEQRMEYDRIIGEYFTKLGKQFGNWGSMGRSGQLKVVKELQAAVVAWPDEVKEALKKSLEG